MVGVQAGGTDGIGGRHTLWQGDPQLGVQGCGGGAALVQQQPGRVAMNVATRLDSARTSAAAAGLWSALFSRSRRPPRPGFPR
jgi:hypothetical protein